ncbi:hypothetical protein ACTXT7_003517 [Hymenolepis weldensis]
MATQYHRKSLFSGHKLRIKELETEPRFELRMRVARKTRRNKNEKDVIISRICIDETVCYVNFSNSANQTFLAYQRISKAFRFISANLELVILINMVHAEPLACMHY